ncbi:MAG: hypothetical protein ACRC8A_05960 [Microcoleaceae cyanobacterium]
MIRQEFAESELHKVSITKVSVKYVGGSEPEFIYQSAIALQISRSQGQPALAIANQIVDLWKQEAARFDASPRLLNWFVLEVCPLGMILFRLIPEGVAGWLQMMVQLPLSSHSQSCFQHFSPLFAEHSKSLKPVVEENSLPETKLLSLSPHVFWLQYSHARCCSLLRLGHREGLVVLSQPDPDSTPMLWSVIQPCPFLWFDADHHFYLVHKAEHQLVINLFAVLDLSHCSSVSKARWERLACQLGQTFRIFYAHCQILGEAKQGNPMLAQARLGLLVVAQSLFWFVLRERLSVFAPLEL